MVYPHEQLGGDADQQYAYDVHQLPGMPVRREQILSCMAFYIGSNLTSHFMSEQLKMGQAVQYIDAGFHVLPFKCIQYRTALLLDIRKYDLFRLIQNQILSIELIFMLHLPAERIGILRVHVHQPGIHADMAALFQIPGHKNQVLPMGVFHGEPDMQFLYYVPDKNLVP